MGTENRPFPTKEEVRRFIEESPGPVTKREVARAFKITGNDRVALKQMIRELQRDGTLEKEAGRRLTAPGRLPSVCVARVVGPDADGELIAKPVTWRDEGPAPVIYIEPERRGHHTLSAGDTVLTRIRPGADGSYEGRIMRRLDRETAGTRLIGTVMRHGDRLFVRSADRRRSHDYTVTERDLAGAAEGDLVLAESPHGQPGRARQAMVLRRLGKATDPAVIVEIALHNAEIPTEFTTPALEEAASAVVPALEDRVDLRDLPLVTIDGADAKDFDDAVYAEPDTDPSNPGGWKLIVSIADVSAYVPPGSALDEEAFNRGNSVYFPGRVVPMLPEALSNGVCSLVPDEDRACLAARMRITSTGRLLDHRFERALMRSRARLTYEQVQAAHNGVQDSITDPLTETVIAPLYGAYEALSKARGHRGTLDLELPEHVVHLHEDGSVHRLGLRQRLDSHRLIEEFMITANVAAAQALGERQVPCLYRIHDSPDPARLEALREFLKPLGYSLSKGQVIKPIMFTQVLDQAADRPEAEMINQMVLRSQAQAAYSPDNIGHFGLALPQYVHFTSPIRRYADLTVHRGLIRTFKLGHGGMTDRELERLESIGTHISSTERRAAQAERDAVDRFVAAYLSEQVGQIFEARVSGVTRFGLFVTLRDTGADGLVPISSLPEDYYEHDERSHTLVGRRWGRVFRMGAAVRAKLIEADPLTASTVFNLVDVDDGADPFAEDGATPRRVPMADRHKKGRKATKDASSGGRGKGGPAPSRRKR